MNYFRSIRWDAGIQNALEAATKKVDDVEGGGVLQAALVPVANVALTYYDRRIKAYFARAGIDLGDDVLTVEKMREKIQSATDLEIDELTVEGLMRAVEKPLARELSKLLGFVVTAVFDEVELMLQVKRHVLERLEDGEGGGVLKGRTLHRLRVAATLAKSGASPGDRRRVLNRAYQRKYRMSHAQTWV